jgi:AsmA protein
LNFSRKVLFIFFALIVQSSMQESNTSHLLRVVERSTFLRRRLLAVAAAVLALLLVLLLPPYINVSRYQRRVAGNIGAALGRAVHFDSITLNLLPIPGFTLENFVVEEDPAFGSEPILRAGEVRVNIRLRSLWTRQVEFSRIVLTDPSVNLVHLCNGRWNIESLFLQASRSNAAPTAQTYSGPSPRFPYIEASNARLNFKLDQIKTPISLTDADFALWLPQPHQWRLRVESHPVRTDSSPADSGTLRLEATLGSASGAPVSSLAQVPIDLRGDWKQIQLGGLSRLLLARDAGLRGELTLAFHILGTLGQSDITTNISLDNARRDDFVPPQPLSVVVSCSSHVQNTFHTFNNVECHWPTSGPGAITFTANLPEIRQPHNVSAALSIPSLPAETFFDWLAVATPHPPTGFTGQGTLSANLFWGTEQQTQENVQPTLTGEMKFSGESLDLAALGPKPIPLGDLLLRGTPPPPATSRRPRSGVQTPAAPATSFDLAPISLPLGGKQSAILEGRFDSDGYTLHLIGSALPARLLALGDAVPQLGDGLRPLLEPTNPLGSNDDPKSTASESSAQPIRFDLTAARPWGGSQIWHQTAAPPPTHPHHRTTR